MDRFYIEGQMYTIDTLNNLPESLQLAEVSVKKVHTLYSILLAALSTV